MSGTLPYRNLIFIPGLFAFYILLKIFGSPDIQLMHFDGRSISVATAEGIDIGARVSLFYKGLAFLIFLLLALTKLLRVVEKFIPKEELQIMNGLSLAGTGLLFFKVLGADVGPTIHLIFGLIGIVGVGSIFHQVRKRNETNFSIPFIWSSLLGFSVFFLQWHIF